MKFSSFTDENSIHILVGQVFLVIDPLICYAPNQLMFFPIQNPQLFGLGTTIASLCAPVKDVKIFPVFYIKTLDFHIK